MSTMTFEDLKTIMAQCAGEDEHVGFDEQSVDTAFSDLGYDSLALLEAAAVITQRYGVALPDDEVNVALSPRALLDRVNDAAAQAA
jgi:act minimal PKS acyl carrier protein